MYVRLIKYAMRTSDDVGSNPPLPHNLTSFLLLRHQDLVLEGLVFFYSVDTVFVVMCVIVLDKVAQVKKHGNIHFRVRIRRTFASAGDGIKHSFFAQSAE